MLPEEWALDQAVEDLETKMEEAIKEQRYSDAVAVRDELFRLQMDETSGVLSANAGFYAAFTERDANLMASLWLESESVMCVHPGKKPAIGYRDVVANWKSLFGSSDTNFKASMISAKNIKVHVRGTTALVSCTEEVALKAQPSKTLQALTATNVYQKSDGQWWIVHHHASEASSSDSQPRIINLSSGGAGLGAGSVNDVLDALKGAAQDSDDDVEIDVTFGSTGMGPGQFQQPSSGLQLPSFGVRAPGTSGPEAHGLGTSGSLGTNAKNGSRGDGGLKEIGGKQDEDYDDDDDDDEEEEEEEDPDALRKATIALIRSLAKEGRIANDERKKLLSSIVLHASDEASASPVELACKLLAGGADEPPPEVSQVPLAC
ncbi:unnamed protein product [Chrysoparadoxa australica]